MAGLSYKIITIEKRQAVLRFPQYEITKDCETVRAGVHKESVFVYPLLSNNERALCEHQDGTVTEEYWEHIKFLDSKARFDEYDWTA